MAFHCTQESGTEPAFTGIYTDEKTQGTYKCIVCEVDLFHSAENTIREVVGLAFGIQLMKNPWILK